MKKFTRIELISLSVIFLILIAVAVPNFILSLRRARDQTRRDDMGALNHAFDEYLADNNSGLPLASPDGRIIDCLPSGVNPVKNKLGSWTYTPIACNWGKDAFANLVTGRIYMSTLPQDPDSKKGVNYLYFSDGNRYQIYASMEGSDEPEVDPKIIALGLKCGNRICNVGRSYNVPIDMSIQAYDALLLLQQQQKQK
ncbi:MAG: type II secretion system protein [Candidatus Microgenomates bacterium]